MQAYNCISIDSIFNEAYIRLSLKPVAVTSLVYLLLIFFFFFLTKNYKNKVFSSSDFVLSYLKEVGLEDITQISSSTPLQVQM